MTKRKAEVDIEQLKHFATASLFCSACSSSAAGPPLHSNIVGGSSPNCPAIWSICLCRVAWKRTKCELMGSSNGDWKNRKARQVLREQITCKHTQRWVNYRYVSGNHFKCSMLAYNSWKHVTDSMDQHLMLTKRLKKKKLKAAAISGNWPDF